MASTYKQYVRELGAVVTFPSDFTEEEKQEFIQRTLASRSPATPPAPPPPTSSTMDDVLRNVGGFALGVPRGIIEGIAAVPEGIGGITGSELLKSTGAAIRDNPLANLFAGEASTGRMAGELIGNLATFFAPGSIAKLAGAPKLATALTAVIGGASGAAEQVREEEQNRLAGMQITPEQAQTAAILGTLPGLAETLVPFGRLTRNLAPGLAGAAQIAGEGLGARAARIAGSAAVGGLTEGAQRGLQNVIEQQVYNPQQDALEGIVQEAGIGAVAEGGLEGLIGFLTKRVAVKGLLAKQQRVREGASATVEAGTQDATAVETDAEGFPVYRHVGKRQINPYAPFAGASTSEAVGIAPVEPVGDVAGAGEAVLPTDVTIPGLTGLYAPSPESSTLRVQPSPARTTNPYAPFPGGSTFERLAQQMNERARVLSQPGADIVSAPPATGPIPAPPEVPFFPMSSTYGMARTPSPMLPTVDEFGNIIPAGETVPPPGAALPTGEPVVRETPSSLPDYMRGLSPENLAFAEDLQAMLPTETPAAVETPVARRDIEAEQRRRAAILEEILNPRPPYVEPITPNYPMPTIPVSLTSEGTFRQPSNLYTDIPRTMRGTGIPVASPTIQRQAAAPPVTAETSLFPGVSPERDASLRQMFEQKRRQELADEANTLLDRLEVIDQQIETAITPRPDIAQERRTLGAELQDLFSRLTEIDQQIESRIAPGPVLPAVAPTPALPAVAAPPAPEIPPAFTRDPMIDQLLAEQRRQAEEPSAFPQTTTSQRDASLRQMFRRPGLEADRPLMRAQAEQVRAARRTARPTIPETGVPDERVLDAQQRLAREEFNKNLAELNPDELAIVQAKQESGLGTAVRPQEIAEVQEFADLPFTRDQYRQAIEIGKTTAPMGTRGVASASTIARSLNVPVETAQSITDTMLRRGDATPIPRSPGTIRINPAATGPRFSVETQATPEPAPTPEPITVEAFRQRIARGEIPEVPSQIHSELKALGVDDLLSARLVDSLGNPQVAGQYANRIVSLALAGRSPDQLRSTLNHEVVHALKELGIFSTAEWNLLQNTLTPSAVLSEDEQKFYTDLYKNDPEALAEEAVARGMQKFIDGRMDLPRPAAAAVEKTTSVFSKLGDLFRDRGLETPEQVIGAFRAGEIGRRQLPGETPTAATQPTVAAGRQPNTADTTNVRDLETLLGRTDSEGYVIPEERARLSYVGERAYSEDPVESARIASFRESALKMEQAGEDPEKIRLATGWFRNPYDRMLRYEVGDQGASLTQAFRDLPESEFIGKTNIIPLSQALDHPELFKAYPELKDIKVMKQRGFFDFFQGLQGSFNPETNTINITPYSKDPESTLLHEVQHWIQTKEGFASGGNEQLAIKAAPPQVIEKALAKVVEEKTADLESQANEISTLRAANDIALRYPSDFQELAALRQEKDRRWDQYRKTNSEDDELAWLDASQAESRKFSDIRDRLRSERGLDYNSSFDITWAARNVDPEKIARAERRFVEIQDELAKIRSGDEATISSALKSQAFDIYQNIAGEIESRDVQARQRMTLEERRQARPLSSENISPSDAIIIRPGAESPRLSIEQEPVPNPLFAQPDPQKSIGQRTAETLQVRPTLPSEIRTQVIDRRAPIAQLARAAGTIGKAEVSSEEAVRRLDQANDLAIAGLKFGAVEFVGKPGNGYFIASEGAHPLGSDGYMVRMAKIGKLDKFFHYLAGLRSTPLGEREKQLTPAQIRQFLSYGNDPRIKQAAAEHKQFNDGMIDAVVASGRFSKEEGERLKRNMYIPYLRISETPEGDIRFTAGGSNLASSPKLKALKGGLGQARDPLATYVENVQMLTTMALKNEAMNRISRDGIQTGYIRPARKGDENTVPVWVNGQKKRMTILDPQLYESVTYAPQPLSGMVKILALPARFLRSSVVFNPIYPIRNLIRDSQQVFAQGYTDMPLVSAIDGVRKALTRSESYRDLERFGVVSSNIRGEGGGEGTAREARAMFDDSLLGAVSKGIRAFEDFNQRFEAANRVVVYENLLKRGRTKAQAAAEARELINFNRHGANLAMRTLSALIPFQNARIQGADVLYRAAKPWGKKDNPEMTRQLYNRSVMLAALSMVYAATIQSNPAYQSASKEEQENNWFVPLPDGEAIRVPIPFELGWFVKVVPENLARMMNGTADGKVFLESFQRFVSSTMKLEITPQAIKPFREAMQTNFNDFTQRPVEQDYMKRLELADRYDERTTLVAKKISEYSNGQISPIQADHMLRGYSGTSMNYVWQMVEFLSNPQASPSLSGRQAAEMPVVGTLFARKDGGRKLGEAYEVRDLADQAAASLRLRLREGTPIEAPERERLNREMGFDQAIEPINQALTALNQRERALRRDIRMGRVTGTQAKPELDDIRRRKLDLSERVLEIRKRMVPGG